MMYPVGWLVPRFFHIIHNKIHLTRPFVARECDGTGPVGRSLLTPFLPRSTPWVRHSPHVSPTLPHPLLAPLGGTTVVNEPRSCRFPSSVGHLPPHPPPDRPPLASLAPLTPSLRVGHPPRGPSATLVASRWRVFRLRREPTTPVRLASSLATLVPPGRRALRAA